MTQELLFPLMVTRSYHHAHFRGAHVMEFNRRPIAGVVFFFPKYESLIRVALDPCGLVYANKLISLPIAGLLVLA